MAKKKKWIKWAVLLVFIGAGICIGIGIGNALISVF